MLAEGDLLEHQGHGGGHGQGQAAQLNHIVVRRCVVCSVEFSFWEQSFFFKLYLVQIIMPYHALSHTHLRCPSVCLYVSLCQLKRKKHLFWPKNLFGQKKYLPNILFGPAFLSQFFCASKLKFGKEIFLTNFFFCKKIFLTEQICPIQFVTHCALGCPYFPNMGN